VTISSWRRTLPSGISYFTIPWTRHRPTASTKQYRKQ